MQMFLQNLKFRNDRIWEFLQNERFGKPSEMEIIVNLQYIFCRLESEELVRENPS